MGTSNEGFTILLFLSSLFSVSLISEAADTITTVQFITENETIVSAGGGFELGFFSPGSSKNRYLGMWYQKITTRTVVWVANRETPITDASGVLKVVDPGILVLYNGSGNIVWSSNTSRSVHNPVAQLLESGNFVLRNANDDNPENFLWQSFDYPSDTLLPGMKLGKNLLVGLDRHLSSWKSEDDPAQGDYTFGMNTHGYPQLITDNVTTVMYRTGPWNGLSFSGTQNLKHNPIYEFYFVFNREEVYYGYELLNHSVVSRLVLNPNGILYRRTWVHRKQDWIIYNTSPADTCDNYGSCGAYGSCDIGNSPMCGCLDKFVPRYPKDWDMGDWSNGCMRRTPLACHEGEGFQKYSRVKLPDTQKSWFNETMTLEECGKMCSENCSCMAYANLDIRGGGTGCLLWFGDLIDIREFHTGGQDIFVRMAASELANGKRRDRIIIILALTIGMLLLCPSLTLFVWKKKQRQLKKKVLLELNSRRNNTDESQREDLQLPVLELTTIEKATDNFSINNKLGQGGFGPVYKGRLEDGQEIAIKRLSRISRQGIDEFKNEVICIAKLQHRNLVKLLGCCTQGEERMLIYEFMPNKSLDSFIFGLALS
ncbi:hypothetical protein RHMOL_Rhmol06G0286800 [Rhododendron molle]|uniref:Uncharacterized protein n=1 Tax=Rhododendron molle TaxID=49168 RepID=A0ACC0NHL7_RHOML|nr:hypothetical protein RHMOL_Rhmol06G0286800 [Rhododendron molle]